MKTFLITGGRGFIGSYFVDLCLQNGHKVIDVDKMTYASNKTLPWDNEENYTLIKEDIKDLKHLPLCDIIVNFAAESHVDNAIESPDIFVETNVKGTLNLLNLLRGKPYDRPLFVHVSTDEVYGDYDSEILGRTEEDVLAPSNPYAASKAGADMLVFAWGRTYGINYQITRSSNNYGPRQYPEKLIPRIIKALKEGTSIPLHGNGLYYRDWLYVVDNVSAIYKTCFAEELNNVWNISAYHHLSNIDVVKEVCEWFGKEDYRSCINFIENRLGQDLRYKISSEKIRNKLGWRPSKEGILFNFTKE